MRVTKEFIVKENEGFLVRVKAVPCLSPEERGSSALWQSAATGCVALVAAESLRFPETVGSRVSHDPTRWLKNSCNVLKKILL